MVFSSADALNILPAHFSLNNTWIRRGDEAAKPYFENGVDIDDKTEKNYFYLGEEIVFDLCGNIRQHHIYAIVDKSTNDRYLDESECIVRTKCALIFFACFIVHPIGLVRNTLILLGKSITCSYRGHRYEDILAHDIVRIVATPLIFIGFLFASLYGVFISPYDGRKLYGTLERFYYHSSAIAKCFQPSNPRNLYKRVRDNDCFNCFERGWIDTPLFA